jgi:arylsulfatase A-like enzyme
MPQSRKNKISRREFINSAVLGTAALSSFCCRLSNRKSDRGHPNIIFIMADDLGYGDLSCYGRADYETPNLDRLASQGMRFTQAYSSAPVCTPTRVGFMTGRYPARHPLGQGTALISSSAEHRQLGLNPEHPTVTSQLKEAGYTNALFGKWHLGWQPRFHPNKHGIAEFFGPLCGAVDYVDHKDPDGEHDLYENGSEVFLEGYLTDLITDRAVRFIKKSCEPFFLSLQYTAPHWPWQRRGDPAYPPGRELMDSGDPASYADMVQALDEGVGQILDAVSSTGIANRTLIIFTSDNGGEVYSSMGGLTGRKVSLWEGGIRVPAFASWPTIIPPGITTSQVITTLDWTATILAVASISSTSEFPLDGKNLFPLLKGKKASIDRTVFWRTDIPHLQGACRKGPWKYLKIGDEEYLFHLGRDPGERNNLALTDYERLNNLRSEYIAWSAQMLPLRKND